MFILFKWGYTTKTYRDISNVLPRQFRGFQTISDYKTHFITKLAIADVIIKNVISHNNWFCFKVVYFVHLFPFRFAEKIIILIFN